MVHEDEELLPLGLRISLRLYEIASIVDEFETLLQMSEDLDNPPLRRELDRIRESALRGPKLLHETTIEGAGRQQCMTRTAQKEEWDSNGS